jgi:Protein of unknown function (DUF1232)/Zinc finger, C3HC4 type (RING finger)
VTRHLKCPICFRHFRGAATIHPCGHSFCAECLVGALQASPTCPTCRRRVLSAGKNFALRDGVDDHLSRKGKSLSGAERTAIASADAALPSPDGTSTWDKLRCMFDDDISAENAGMWGVIVLCLLYLVSPLDLIPETVGIVGFLDDLMVLIWLVWYLWDRARRYGV